MAVPVPDIPLDFRPQIRELVASAAQPPRAGVVGSDRRLVGPPAASGRSELFVFESSNCHRDIPRRDRAARGTAHTVTGDVRVNTFEQMRRPLF